MKFTPEAYLDLIQYELLALEKARTDIASFCEYFFGRYVPKHHAVAYGYIKRLLDDEFDILILMMPPNSGKSWVVSIVLPLFYMGSIPKGQILSLSGSQRLADDHGKSTRNSLIGPAIRRIFPNLELNPDSRASNEFKVKSGATYASFSVGAGTLGQRSTLNIVDDPSANAENSEASLQTLHTWYHRQAKTRLDPTTGKTVIIAQRTDRNDLIGHLLDHHAMGDDGLRLKTLTIKAECEPGDTDDPLGRKPGEIIWPERFTRSWINEQKRDAYTWRVLYQQDAPSTTGEWCRTEWINYVDELPKTMLHHYTATDIAVNLGAGDYSVHIVAAIDGLGRVFIVDAWRGRASLEDVAQKHVDLCGFYPVMEALGENDPLSQAYVQTLERICREQRVIVPWKPLAIAGKDKEIRASAFRSLLQAGKVFFLRAPWNQWVQHQLLGFPHLLGAGMDDAIDALGLIGRRFNRMAKPAAPPAPVRAGNPAGSFFDASFNELFEANEKASYGRRRI